MTWFVYFIRCLDRVKIGYSEDPVKRFGKINADAPAPCELLVFVSADTFPEAELHERFSDLRVHGEWFLWGRALREFVEALQEMVGGLALSDMRGRKLSKSSPLVEFARSSGKSLTQIAKDANCGRATLYRVMDGENATVDLLQRISAATGGKVSVAALIPAPPARTSEPAA